MPLGVLVHTICSPPRPNWNVCAVAAFERLPGYNPSPGLCLQRKDLGSLPRSYLRLAAHPRRDADRG